MAEDRYIEIKVKNIDLNIEKEIRFLLANKNKYLLDCEIEETDAFLDFAVMEYTVLIL